MTAEQLRQRVLGLIKDWLQNPDVRKSETAFEVLNDLAGDIEVIDLSGRET